MREFDSHGRKNPGKKALTAVRWTMNLASIVIKSGTKHV
jgi:hypothetical protein